MGKVGCFRVGFVNIGYDKLVFFWLKIIEIDSEISFERGKKEVEGIVIEGIIEIFCRIERLR